MNIKRLYEKWHARGPLFKIIVLLAIMLVVAMKVLRLKGGNNLHEYGDEILGI